ncbi:hypothetical protein llap_5798 [Limosa lapponica baueri]|uniref:Uncharacterized protein n=1 Tax=Limosa lapponica baueri TaxID=1758121 RepID=A0A2I0UCY7_LIMLA|nr:hypothetical protein llap_5798 [Limosa lapponica baueri]
MSLGPFCESQSAAGGDGARDHTGERQATRDTGHYQNVNVSGSNQLLWHCGQPYWLIIFPLSFFILVRRPACGEEHPGQPCAKLESDHNHSRYKEMGYMKLGKRRVAKQEGPLTSGRVQHSLSNAAAETIEYAITHNLVLFHSCHLEQFWQQKGSYDCSLVLYGNSPVYYSGVVNEFTRPSGVFYLLTSIDSA